MLVCVDVFGLVNGLLVHGYEDDVLFYYVVFRSLGLCSCGFG